MQHPTLLELQLEFSGDETRKKLVDFSMTYGKSAKVTRQTASDAAMTLLLRGKSVSYAMSAALKSLATRHLERAYQDGGMKGQLWRLWVRALRDIIASVQPELLLEGAESRRVSQRRGRDALSTLAGIPGVDIKLIHEVGREMMTAFKGIESNAIDSKKWAEAVAVPPVRQPETAKPAETRAVRTQATDAETTAAEREVEIEDGRSPSVDGLPEEFTSLLGDALRPGVWFRVRLNGGTGARWVKLDRYEPDSRRVTFANRDGEVVLERDALEFLRDIARGHAELVHDGEGFERNLGELISRTRDLTAAIVPVVSRDESEASEHSATRH